MARDDDSTNDPADQPTGRSTPRTRPGPTPADRLELVEEILQGYLSAHGETYEGALDHLEQLNKHIAQR